jgi:CBS-domain-containing membrane protein
MTEQQPKGVKLSQAAPTMPIGAKFEVPSPKYGLNQPVSSASIPSVYNKKLNKLFGGRLVVLPGDFTVSEALRRMARFNISSVPVTNSRKDPTILGFVDMLDMLTFLIKLTVQEGKLDTDPEKLRQKTDIFKNTRIADLVDRSGRNPFHILHGEESLSDAVQYYLKGFHRIAISDDNGDIIGVISQWAIANYLATVPTDDKEWIPSLRESVGVSNYSRDVISVNKNESALNSFLLMHQNQLSSLAILDDNEVLWGNLSASDLKGFQLFLSDFNDLLQPVSQFVATIRKKQGRPENFVVAVTPDTPVLDVLTRFNDEIIHRAYIVDPQFKLMGVYSLTDLMQNLIVDTHSIPTYAKPTIVTAQ